MKRVTALLLAVSLLLLTAQLSLAAGFSYGGQLTERQKQIEEAIIENIGQDRVASFDVTFDSPMEFAPNGDAERGVRDEVMRAYEAFYRDHPEVFWVTKEGGITVAPDASYTSGGLSVKGAQITTKFFDEGQIDTKKQALDSAADAILIGASGADYDKVRLFHDTLVSKCDYDMAARNKPAAYPDAYESYGALVNGKAVCEGYAKALKLLCDRAGIPCVIIGGQAGGGEHMWNYVLLDGAWYLVDATFDDPIGGEPTDKYFLKGSASTADHQPQESFIVDFNGEFVDPSLAKNDYAHSASKKSEDRPAGETAKTEKYCTVDYFAGEGGRCTVTFTGIGEAVDRGQQVLSGIHLTVDAQAFSGYRLREITVKMDGETLTESEKHRLRFDVTGNCTITATFERA